MVSAVRQTIKTTTILLKLLLLVNQEQQLFLVQEVQQDTSLGLVRIPIQEPMLLALLI